MGIGRHSLGSACSYEEWFDKVPLLYLSQAELRQFLLVSYYVILECLLH